jgi:uncharacterized repeat protein (TIGR03806 family)
LEGECSVVIALKSPLSSALYESKGEDFPYIFLSLQIIHPHHHEKKSRINRFRLFLFLSPLALILSFEAFSPHPPAPVDPYLNGVFPARLNLGVEDVAIKPAFPNITFDIPLAWAMHPNRDTVFVAQQDGKIYWFEQEEDVQEKHLFLDFTATVGVPWDAGLLGLAMHPNFGKEGETGANYFYIYYTTRDSLGGNEPSYPLPQLCREFAVWNGGYVHLSRLEVEEGTLDVVPGSELVMIKVRHYGSSHYGGGLAFGKDGFLYLATGDQTQHTTAQLINDNLDGGVLRLDVDCNPDISHPPAYLMPKDPRGPDEVNGLGYCIPEDNPFVGLPEVFEEYYSFGHRNPHRMTMDAETGIFYIGEVGSNKHEEINVVKPGGNYGWPVLEGNQLINACTDQLNPLAPVPDTALVIFPRPEANSIIGGYVYRGEKFPFLHGKYICADYGVGEEIWYVDTQTGEYALLSIFDPEDVISFGQDHEGEIYMLRQGFNTPLYTLDTAAAPMPLPQTLSETAAFSDLDALISSDALIPYEMIESFWSDGAEKHRWMVLPNDGSYDSPEEQIRFSEEGEWIFPEGSVLIKHFELPVDESDPSIRRRLETRFTIIGEGGRHYGLTYRWRDDQSDADLLASSLDEDFTIASPNGPKTQTWHYPGRTECLSCHNAASKGTLGLRSRYLNREVEFPSPGIFKNQLVSFSERGILDREISLNDASAFLTHRHQNDLSASLEDRARSYLDLNCGYCHRPEVGNRAVFDAQLKTPLNISGLLSDELNESLGLPNEHIILFGDTLNSVLYQRMHSVDTSIMMPPLAKSRIDEEGASLIAEWILSQSGNPEPCEAVNVALGKPVRQSSTADHRMARLAVDGIRDDVTAAHYRALTEEQEEPWWEVNLQGLHSVRELVIYNYSDGEGLQELYLFTSRQAIQGNTSTALQAEFGVQELLAQVPVGGEIRIPIGRDLQYLRIMRKGYGSLSIGEAEIIACPAENCSDLSGKACDDGDPCTENDIYDEGCLCRGTPVEADADGDGVCDLADQCPGEDDNAIGLICDDEDDCTVGDIWTTACECVGIFLDTDGDGICDREETEPLLNGSASLLDENCYSLTPLDYNQVGSFWMPFDYDLRNELEISFDIYLGKDDNGADGMALVFQQEGREALGPGGGSLGIPDAGPSLAIEFDTYDNGHEPDRPEDHLALVKNGNLNNSLIEPVCMLPICSNLEDGKEHSVQVNWSPVDGLLELYFDGHKRFAHPLDTQLESMFPEGKKVVIGMTAATGGAINEQYVCDFRVEERPLCIPGTPCDDGSACTENDVLDRYCNCRGEDAGLPDSDGDGICDEEDICDGYDDNLPDAPCGEEGVLLFPNPFREGLSVFSDKSFEKVHLFDISGKKVIDLGSMENGLTTWPIGQELSTGVYIIQFVGEGGNVVRKLVKEGRR